MSDTHEPWPGANLRHGALIIDMDLTDRSGYLPSPEGMWSDLAGAVTALADPAEERA
ncbi:hypothetical protein NONO_c59630 [Nocardia nova SH22a]|uniref:Uncharacterized protein n=1 Tax=Nocardia nova SH22a TaxID=1415166 RepID=W5TNK3_9NOCA|nr:hypothetical protein [Nocardia nova]AHH20739.1 hypothetical protein NONO_c59630 [Nocardia nova SH22a]